MSISFDPVRALERSPFFRGIPEHVLHAISIFAEAEQARDGEVMLKAGQEPGRAFFVVQGQMGVALPPEPPRPEGARPPEARPESFGPGALVGHVDLLNQVPSSVTWVAQGNTTVLVFEAPHFRQLVKDNGLPGSVFRRALIMSLSNQLRAANQRVAEYVAANPAAQRPSRGLLAELSGLFQGSRSPEPGPASVPPRKK